MEQQITPATEAMLEDAKALLRGGDIAGTATLARRVLAESPGAAQALLLFGIAATLSRDYGSAVPVLRLALSLQPDNPAAMNAFSIALRESGDHDHACHLAEKAVARQPEQVEFVRNLARAYLAAKRRDEAEDAYARLATLGGGDAADGAKRCLNLHSLGRTAEARAVAAEAVRRWPDDAQAWFHQGLIATYAGENLLAMNSYQKALALDPDNLQTRLNLVVVFRRLGNPARAVQECREAFARGADSIPGAHMNMGSALGSLGFAGEAVAAFARCEALQADPAAGSNRVYYSCYLDDCDNAELFARHRDWARRYAPASARMAVTARTRDPARRLRIGYVSPDFRGHSCYFFLAPLYDHHDRGAVEIFSYSGVEVPDRFTEQLRAAEGHWRDTSRLSDDALAAQIDRDGIDILVDLAGHTAYNRLPVFARKPAPVQVTWLGYPTTTGLDAIDWRLSDPWLTPEDTTEGFSEGIYRLDRPSHCYRSVPEYTPEIGPPPCDEAGTITFGSFNNYMKISDAALRLWAGALAAVPQARLLLKYRYIESREASDTLRRRFAEAGGDASRLFFTSGQERVRDHIAQYNSIDIALDTFPYGGMTTTCEALMMGVPVICLAGDRTSARYAVPLLHALGLDDLIAGSPEHFTAIAARLAADRDRLRALRGGLRATMQASSLCDEAGFARAVEAAYRDMWTRWCRSG